MQMKRTCAMELDEFRRIHSQLIEHYQFVEFNLEGIYASICGEPFVRGLHMVENDNIQRLISKIHAIERQSGELYLSEEECERLEELCRRRNFWCHNCYVDLVFDSRTGGIKKESDVRALMDDFREAEDMRKLLFEKKLPLMPKATNDNL